MGSMYIMDRQLPERANLSFFFSNPIEGDEYFVVRMPFFENPKIQETKRARYKKHSLLARSSNLYTYLGADSKKLSVSFSITLPHILEEYPNVIKDSFMTPPPGFAEDEKKRFVSPTHKDEQVGIPADRYRHYHFTNNEFLDGQALSLLSRTWVTDAEADYIKGVYGITNYEAKQQNSVNAKAIEFAKNLNLFGVQPLESLETPTIPMTNEKAANKLEESRWKRLDLIDIIIYWLNIIRSSVINHSKNPLHGPPIIRLNHGLLYQDVPCICNDYSVEWDERAGYDLDTLLPRKLNIRLNLEEIRTGNFKNFNPNEIIERDNLAGWESVISEGQSLDPGYNIYMKDKDWW